MLEIVFLVILTAVFAFIVGVIIGREMYERELFKIRIKANIKKRN